jgi:phenylacetate-CoA ligase
MNLVMPFIRYQTNDVITKLDNPNYDFSNPITIEKIDGRVDDMVVSSNGTKIPSVNFYTVMSKFDEIKMFQINQNLKKELTINLVVTDFFNPSTLEKLTSELSQRVGDLPLQFKIVDEIYRNTKTGKIRCVTTEIK